MLLPLIFLISGYSFSIYGNNLVVTQLINGTYLVSFYYHFTYYNFTQVLSGNVTIYYQPYELSVISQLPQLIAVKVTSGNFSAIAWSGISLTPLAIKVPAYINGTGTVTLYFLNGTSYTTVRLPVIQGLNETYKISLNVYPVVSIGPITSSQPQKFDLTIPPPEGYTGFLTLNRTLVPALIGQGFAYVYGLNGTISGLIIEEYSPSLSLVYIKIPELPPSVSTLSYDGIYLSLLKNGTLLTNVKYYISGRSSLGYVIDAKGKSFMVFFDKVSPIESLTLTGNISKVVPTPKGIYTIIVAKYIGNEPAVVYVPLPAELINVSATPPYSLISYNVSSGYLRAFLVGPSNLTIYVYTPPSGFAFNLVTALLIVLFVLTAIVVILIVKLMRK